MKTHYLTGQDLGEVAKRFANWIQTNPDVRIRQLLSYGREDDNGTYVFQYEIDYMGDVSNIDAATQGNTASDDVVPATEGRASPPPKPQSGWTDSGQN